MQNQIEKSFAASCTRESTFGTSNHSLKQVMGLYDKIEIYDFVGKDNNFDVDGSLFYKAYDM